MQDLYCRIDLQSVSRVDVETLDKAVASVDDSVNGRRDAMLSTIITDMGIQYSVL